MIKLISASLENKSPKADAYWISPSGRVLAVNRTHIDEVVNDPISFGFTDGEINAIHEKHGEPRGLEGKARGEIMTQLLKRGWIRIRHIPRQDMWSIQCFNLGSYQKDYLFYWAKDMIAIENHKYADVRLDDGKQVQLSSVEGLMSSDILSSIKPWKPRAKITYINSSWEFLEIRTEDEV